MHQSTTKTQTSRTRRRRSAHLRAVGSAALVAALLVQMLLPMTALADGDFGWAVPLGSGAKTEGYSIAVDGAGNVLTTGSFFGSGDFSPNASSPVVSSTGDEDVYISRLNTDGQFDGTSKELKVGGTAKDIGHGIAADTAGNIITVGQFRGTGDFDPGPSTQSLTAVTGDDIFVLKLDNNGAYQWAKSYGSTGVNPTYEDIAYGTTTDSSNNVYVVGHFSGAVEFDPAPGGTLTSGGGTDGFFLKLDSTGAYQWVKQVTSPSPNRTIDVVAADGFVYTSGYFQGTANFGGAPISTFGGRDGFVTKHAEDGTFQWSKRIGGSQSDVMYGVDVDGSGNVYATGVFSGTANFDTSGIGSTNLTTAGGRDAFVVKLGNNGLLQWVNQIGGAGNDEGFDIQVGTDGRVYVTGYFNGSIDFGPLGTLTATGGNNAFMAVYDSGGTLQLVRQLGNGANTTGYGLALDSANNAAITGVFNGTGDFNPDPVGTASFTSAGGSDAFVVELTSGGAPVNNPPVAVDDSFSVNQGTTNQALAVLTNDSDFEDVKPTIQSVDTSGLSGSAVISGTTISYSTPGAAFTGLDVFSYTVVDSGGLTDTATVSVTVTSVGANTPPVAATQPTVGMVKNTSKVITLSGSDADGDTLTFSIATPPTNGTLGAVTPVGSTSATVEYTPNTDYAGPDSFTFQVDDGNGGTDTEVVNINVAADAGSAPVANDVTATVDEDASVTITFSATDADPGDTLSYSVVTTPTNGVLGSVVNDTVVYTPTADYNGPDSFTYMVMDSAGQTDTASVNITVNPTNDGPTAPSEPQQVGVGENSTQSIQLTGNDLDGDDLTFTILAQPANGTLSAISKTGATTATVDYTPNAGFVGTDSFIYEVSDGSATAQATVNITVNEMNDAPVANDVSATTTEVAPVTIQLTATDADGDELTFSVISLPTAGTLSGITVIDDSNASIVYTPTEAGTFTFEFEVDDGNGGTDTATVTVTVTEVTGGGDDDVEVFLPITPKS